MAPTAVPVRERLLDAADSLLFVAGAFATPVDMILRQAGASPPSLYSHFGNKTGLVTAALQRRLEVWTGAWDAAIAAAEGPVDRLLAVYPALRTYQEVHLAERWCAFTNTAAGSPRPSPDLAEVLEAEARLLRERHQALAADLLGAGGAAEKLARSLVVVYGGTIVGMLRGSWDSALDDGEATACTLIEAALAS